MRGRGLHCHAIKAFACAFISVAVTVHGADFSFEWQTNALKVSGLSSATSTNWPRLLSVYADQGTSVTASINMPAIAGKYDFQNGILTFTPQYPFQAQINYRAILRADEKAPVASTHRILAPAAQPTTTVAAIYPTPDRLPENILKFYLQFSGSMSGGGIYEHIHLRDSEGKDVELPFLEIDEELWDPAMTRLTLFLDPGRIKRGVKPLEDIGPALEIGKTYTLRISRDWRDAQGAPIKADFEKSFKVLPPDRDPPNPAQWKISAPNSNSRDALNVTFDEPIDHALAQRVLRVADPNGMPVSGEVKLGATDTVWTFQPTASWKPGAHKLVVPTIIEDLAGNNIGKPFDVDLAENRKPMTNDVIRLTFTVK